MRQHVSEVAKTAREVWFKDHVAKLSLDGGMDFLTWYKPGSYTYSIFYVRVGAVLFVAGDLGEAVYKWATSIDLKFIAGCDPWYFAEKCVASEVGRKFVTWDRDTAMATLKQMLWDEGHPESVRKLAKVGNYTTSRDNWDAYLHCCPSDLLGENWSEWAPSIGEVIHPRCIAHLVGLQMAMKQLEQRSEA